MNNITQRLRQMAGHTGLDAVAELLREAADTIERREAVIRILERDALAEQPAEQKPVCQECDGTGKVAGSQAHFDCPLCSTPEAPQPAKRVPLTREELANAWLSVERITNATERQIAFARAIEAAHGITGEPQ